METISAKVPADLKRALEAEGVNVSETVREALEAEVERRRRERLVEESGALAREIDDCLDVEDAVDRAVRDVRSARGDR